MDCGPRTISWLCLPHVCRVAQEPATWEDDAHRHNSWPSRSARSQSALLGRTQETILMSLVRSQDHISLRMFAFPHAEQKLSSHDDGVTTWLPDLDWLWTVQLTWAYCRIPGDIRVDIRTERRRDGCPSCHLLLKMANRGFQRGEHVSSSEFGRATTLVNQRATWTLSVKLPRHIPVKTDHRWVYKVTILSVVPWEGNSLMINFTLCLNGWLWTHFSHLTF